MDVVDFMSLLSRRWVEHRGLYDACFNAYVQRTGFEEPGLAGAMTIDSCWEEGSTDIDHLSIASGLSESDKYEPTTASSPKPPLQCPQPASFAWMGTMATLSGAGC